MRPTCVRLLVFAALALFWKPSIAGADHGKIDLVVLRNGDRITCEMVSLARGRLTVKTDAMGTATIKWIDIRSVESPVPFEVELSSGRRILGWLAASSTDTLQIKTADGEVVVSTEAVVKLEPMEGGFWQRLDGSVNVGFSFTQADTLTQWSINADASRRTQRFLFQGAYDSMLSITGSDDRQTRNTVTVTVQRFLSRRWFTSLFTQVTQNEELGLNLRAATGGSVGRYFVESNRNELTALAGVSYTREQFVDQPGANRAEAVQGVRWDLFAFGERDIDVTNSLSFFEGLEAPARVRLELRSQMQFKIVKDLHWTLSLLESFDSAPPEGQKRNDLGLSAALGWTF